MYTNFVSGMLFPAHEMLKGHSSVAIRKSLERSQWWSREEIEDLQSRKLRKFITELSASVPYYRYLFNESDIIASQIQSAADLTALPFLTKQIVRDNHDYLISTKAGPLTRLNTGGSTGQPMIFQVGRDRVSHDVGAKWRATRWWNVDIGDRELVLWGSPIELGGQDLIKKWRDRLMRTRLFSAFKMNESTIESIIRYIRDKRPKMLFGYPSAWAVIAQRVLDSGKPLENAVEVAFVTAEKCYPYQRDAIETAFGCRVANGYGGRDAGFIAHECPEGGLHICAEDIVVELLDVNGTPVPDGEIGEIVVTHLATKDFPFLRYRTGDMASRATNACSCGRGLPVFEEVSGRATDFVMAADGTLMHGLSLIYILRDLSDIDAFKIIQKDKLHIVIQIVAGAGYARDVEADVCAEFRKRLGEMVHVKIDLVERIAPEKSGKYRYVVNEMPVAQIGAGRSS